MQTNNPNTPLKLPKLRKNLSVVFNDYDSDGKPQWLIHDSGRNKFFLIGWPEYELIERWQLNNPEAIIESINNETTLHIELSDIENFIMFLKRNYLIDQSGYAIHQQAKEQELFKNDNWIHWLISNYLFFRIPLFHPDAFLTKTKSIATFVFSRYVAYVMLVLAVIAIYQLSIQWDDFTHTFSSIFTLQGLFFSLIAFLICKFCHELGHAYMCKSYDVPIPSVGVAFLVFWPVLYTDTTLSWSLSSEKRLRIAFAGIWVETYITIIAALIWCNTSNITLQAICYVTITVNWMASILINVSPFMRFDGYYILADYLKMPNLQPRAFALTRWQIRRWLFGWSDEAPEKFNRRMHNFLIAYSLFTWIYRLSLYFGIALLVYHFSIKLIGILLFAIEMMYFILSPFINEVRTWIQYKDKFSLNKRTICTISVTIFLIILFFLPIRTSINFPATVSYTHQFLIAPENSTLVTKLPLPNTPVKAGETLVKLQSVKVTEALQELELEYNKKLNEIRRSAINPKFSEQKNELISDAKKLQAQYKQLIEIQNKMTLRSPFDGIVAEVAPELRPGTILSKGEWIGDVIQPNTIRIEAYVTQIDVNDVKPNLTGKFYPFNISIPSIDVKVVSIEALNANQLSCRYSTEIKHDKNENLAIETPCYNASDLGGEIPTYQSDNGDYVPTTSTYRIILTSQDPMQLTHVERGTIILKSTRRSYAFRLFYKLKTILLEESGF